MLPNTVELVDWTLSCFSSRRDPPPHKYGDPGGEPVSLGLLGGEEDIAGEHLFVIDAETEDLRGEEAPSDEDAAEHSISGHPLIVAPSTESRSKAVVDVEAIWMSSIGLRVTLRREEVPLRDDRIESPSRLPIIVAEDAKPEVTGGGDRLSRGEAEPEMALAD